MFKPVMHLRKLFCDVFGDVEMVTSSANSGSGPGTREMTKQIKFPESGVEDVHNCKKTAALAAPSLSRQPLIRRRPLSINLVR